MGFADEVTDVTNACFQDLGDEATFTPKTGGVFGAAVPTLATLDEPNQDMLSNYPRAALRERKVSMWLLRNDLDSQIKGVGIPERGSLLSTLGRNFKVDAILDTDPDRVHVALEELPA